MTCSFVLSVFASEEQNPIWQLRPPMDGVVSAACDLDVTHQISLILQGVEQVPVRLDENWASGSWPRFLRTNVDEKTQSGPRRILDLLREPFGLLAASFITTPERSTLRKDVSEQLGMFPGHISGARSSAAIAAKQR